MSAKRYEKEIVYVDPDYFDLVPGFLQSRRNEIGRIKECLQSGDFKEVHRLGHGMKGAGAGYGFNEISSIGKRIESAAKEEDAAAVADALISLDDYLAVVEVLPGAPE
jgi:HPt (histidine-containing phosphotransfer) domain-containing protein